MATVFRIGLLVAFVVVIQAADNFEYTAELVESLPDYGRLRAQTNAIHLRYELLSDTKLRFRRDEEKSGINFMVRNSLPEGVEPEPVMKAYLSKSPVQLDFFLREMQFDVLQTRAGLPYMQLTVTFQEPEKKRTIEVITQLYKAPSEKVNEDHQQANDVAVVPGPLPHNIDEMNETDDERDEFTFVPDHMLTEEERKKRKQKFQGDIGWMEAILKRALFEGTLPEDFFGIYTERYFAGPTILDLDDFYAIIRLDPEFLEYCPEAEGIIQL